MPNPYDTTGFFQALAHHTADIQFVFPKWHGGNLGVNLDQLTGKPREIQGAEIALSDQITAAWTKFAKYGNPNTLAARGFQQLRSDRRIRDRHLSGRAAARGRLGRDSAKGGFCGKAHA